MLSFLPRDVLDEIWDLIELVSEIFLLTLTYILNIFLERIMTDALEKHDRKFSIGGRNITNLHFADDINALAEEEQEALVDNLDKICASIR